MTVDLGALVRPYADRTNHSAAELARLIRADTIPHVARCADGEVLAMLGAPGVSADQHPFHAEMGRAVVEALNIFVRTPNLWLGNFFYFPHGPYIHAVVDRLGGQADWIVAEVFMHEATRHILDTVEVYRTIRESKRRKILIAPERLSRAAGWLGCAGHVQVPLRDGWHAYDDVKRRALESVRPGDLVLACYGIPAKPIMAALLTDRPGATVLDLGTGLDPLCGHRSRSSQLPTDEICELYGGDVPR